MPLTDEFRDWGFWTLSLDFCLSPCPFRVVLPWFCASRWDPGDPFPGRPPPHATHRNLTSWYTLLWRWYWSVSQKLMVQRVSKSRNGSWHFVYLAMFSIVSLLPFRVWNLISLVGKFSLTDCCDFSAQAKFKIESKHSIFSNSNLISGTWLWWIVVLYRRYMVVMNSSLWLWWLVQCTISACMQYWVSHKRTNRYSMEQYKYFA